MFSLDAHSRAHFQLSLSLVFILVLSLVLNLILILSSPLPLHNRLDPLASSSRSESKNPTKRRRLSHAPPLSVPRSSSTYQTRTGSGRTPGLPHPSRTSLCCN
jgi:hypothetical protein